MSFLKARIFAFAAALLLLFSCGGEQDVLLNVSLAEDVVSSDAGQVYVKVASDVAWGLSLEGAPDWARLSTTSGSGNKNSIVLSYDANPEEASRSLRVVAVASGSGKSVSATLTQEGVTSQTVSARGDGGSGAFAPFNWLELPQTSATDDLDFFWHDTEIDGRKVRNYSFYWNYTDRVSIWVAYPLCSAYMGSQDRSEAWGYDMLLPAAKQQNVSGGYRVGNNGFYDRGHQIPSADRTANYSMNAATFYGTNMTPQKNDFNAGIWAKLEKKVRDWSKLSDTLYVVTGCVTTGWKNYVLDRSNAQIPAPTAYFKAVLRYKGNSTVGRSGYMGAAFWYEHETVDWGDRNFSKNESLSISELEQKLGYQLFVNLPDRVGAATANEIKSEKPSTMNWW